MAGPFQSSEGHTYCVQSKFVIAGTAFETQQLWLCGFSRSSGLTPPFQIRIVHFDQNRTIKYHFSVGF